MTQNAHKNLIKNVILIAITRFSLAFSFNSCLVPSLPVAESGLECLGAVFAAICIYIIIVTVRFLRCRWYRCERMKQHQPNRNAMQMNENNQKKIKTIKLLAFSTPTVNNWAALLTSEFPKIFLCAEMKHYIYLFIYFFPPYSFRSIELLQWKNIEINGNIYCKLRLPWCRELNSQVRLLQPQRTQTHTQHKKCFEWMCASKLSSSQDKFSHRWLI